MSQDPEFFRYAFDLCDFECSRITVFLSTVKYTRDEFNEICTNCAKKAVKKYLNQIEIPFITDDNEIIEFSQYDDGDVTIWSSDEHTNFANVYPTFVQQMEDAGFSVESNEIEASFYLNEYTYIDEHLRQEVKGIIEHRKRAEKIDVIEEKIWDGLYDHVKDNATSIDHAMELVRNWIKVN